MTREDTERHYDATKHVRYEQRFPDFYVCRECIEIQDGDLARAIIQGFPG